jgi:TonB-dependent receptor
MHTLTSLRAFARLLFRSCCLLSLLVAPAMQAQSQSSGEVTGTVRNSATGAFLGGAEVRIVGTALVTLTQRDGSFSLGNVPAGAQRVRVFYTGLDPQEATVQVAASAVATVAIALESGVYKLEAFSVAGQREGNAAAITRQRQAENVINVVSMDAYGNVADGNIGNFLQNMTGVAVTKEAGDIVGIGLRGAPPELNSVSLDGARMAGAIAGFTPQGDRAALIDQIPADFIKEIEVTKGNTPDQPADSLGGTVNLVTKSAFDFKQRVLTYRAGLNLNTYRKGEVTRQQLAPFNLGRYGPTAALTFMDAFGPQRQYGLSLSGSYSQTTNTRDRIQMSRPNADNLISTQARQLNDVNTRVRGGLSGKLEYRVDRSLRVGLSAALNYYAADNDRVDWNITSTNRVADYSKVSRAQIEAGAIPRDATNQAAGIAPGYTDTYNELLYATALNRSAHEVKRSHQYKVGFDLRKDWSGSKLTLAASFNPSSYDNNFWGFSPTITGVGVGYDSSRDSTRPVFSQTYGPAIGVGSDFRNYTASRFEQPDLTREEMGDLRADYVRNLSFGEVALALKTGAALRNQHRWWINTYRPTWNYTGADGVQGKNAVTGLNDDNIAQFLAPASENYSVFNNRMMMRDTFDYRLADASYRANPSYWPASGTTVSTKAIPRIVSESVGAAYLQGTMNIGHLNVLGGLRMEHTDVGGVGAYADPKSPAETSVRVDKAYQQWFPSVHLRYTVTPSFLLRGSYSTSGARPALSSVVPNTTVSYLTDGSGLGRVSQNNAGLKPQYTRNLDFSAEYYLEPAGVISAGFFRKDISNFIATSVVMIGSGQENGFNGRYANFELTTTGNLGSAFVTGTELGYNQQLRFLPKPFDRVSVFANYTGLKTEGTYASGASELANFVPRTYNVGVNVVVGRLETRVTYHYKSGYLSGYSPVPVSQTRVFDDPTVDLNLQFRLRPALTLFVDYINIFNNSPDWWHVTKRHILMSELYGSRLNVGVSGRF